METEFQRVTSGDETHHLSHLQQAGKKEEVSMPVDKEKSPTFLKNS